MRIFTDSFSITDIPRTAVALGNFDGVHLGHAELIRNMVKAAKMRGIIPAVFTFSNHPHNVLSGNEQMRSLLNAQDKARVLESLGVEYLFSLPFGEDFMHMSPLDFVDMMIIGKFNASLIACGYNFRFGAGATGHSNTLQDLAASRGFEVDVMPPFLVDGVIVSSSLIRDMVASGRLSEAGKLLGRPYSMSGLIVRGNGNGRRFGFPTANIEANKEMMCPKFGVYVSNAELDGEVFKSVTNVGLRPTIGGNKLFIETNIFGIPDVDLYGRSLRVDFLEMIREEKEFDSVEQLIGQVSEDRAIAESKHGFMI